MDNKQVKKQLKPSLPTLDQVEELETLELVEPLKSIDTTQELKVQTIIFKDGNESRKSSVNEYEQALMENDVSMLAEEESYIRDSNVSIESREYIEQVQFITPEELESLPEEKQKKMKLQILTDIRKRLIDEDEQNRYEALQQFSYYADENNIVLLNKLVTDESEFIKTEIITIVSKFANNNSINILEMIKRDKDTKISSMALEALSEIDPRYSKPVTTVDKQEEKPVVQKVVQSEPSQEKGGLGSLFKKF